MTKIKNFIFDIDGTLIDTFNMYMPALFEILANHGYRFSDPQKLQRQYYGIAAIDTLHRLKVPDNLIPSINQEWIDLAYQRFDLVTVLPGIAPVIKELAANPNNNLAIVTSKTKLEYQNYFQDRYSFAPAFTVVITADDTQHHKPDPEPLELAMDKLRVNPAETIYVGDMVTDLQAAHAAGINFAAADYGSLNPQKLIDADYHILQPSDLLKLVK